jgi:hypothetical protein
VALVGSLGWRPRDRRKESAICFQIAAECNGNGRRHTCAAKTSHFKGASVGGLGRQRPRSVALVGSLGTNGRKFWASLASTVAKNL